MGKVTPKKSPKKRNPGRSRSRQQTHSGIPSVRAHMTVPMRTRASRQGIGAGFVRVGWSSLSYGPPVKAVSELSNPLPRDWTHLTPKRRQQVLYRVLMRLTSSFEQIKGIYMPERKRKGSDGLIDASIECLRQTGRRRRNGIHRGRKLYGGVGG